MFSLLAHPSSVSTLDAAPSVSIGQCQSLSLNNSPLQYSFVTIFSACFFFPPYHKGWLRQVPKEVRRLASNQEPVSYHTSFRLLMFVVNIRCQYHQSDTNHHKNFVQYSPILSRFQQRILFLVIVLVRDFAFCLVFGVARCFFPKKTMLWRHYTNMEKHLDIIKPPINPRLSALLNTQAATVTPFLSNIPRFHREIHQESLLFSNPRLQKKI